MDSQGERSASVTVLRETGGGRLGRTRLDAVLRALNHPLRRRILQVLSEQPASARTLADIFDEDLGVVSYHLNRVLAKECEVVLLAEQIPRRGAVEKVYVLDPEIWDHRGLGSLLSGSVCEWSALQVDQEAWSEIRKAKSEFRKRVYEAAERGRARHERGESQAQRVILGVAAFPEPPD